MVCGFVLSSSGTPGRRVDDVPCTTKVAVTEVSRRGVVQEGRVYMYGRRESSSVIDDVDMGGWNGNRRNSGEKLSAYAVVVMSKFREVIANEVRTARRGTVDVVVENNGIPCARST